MNKLLQPGNAKLAKGTFAMFNIPASDLICNRTCAGCFAISEQTRWPNVSKARQLRYEATLQPDFVLRIKAELSAMKTPPKYVRIHSSGEFYAQQYVKDWSRIASAFPTIIFYAYTKRLADFDFTPLKSLTNVVIIDSLHFGSINYGTHSEAPPKAFICPDQKGSTVQCGITCKWCMSKSKAESKGVFFIKH